MTEAKLKALLRTWQERLGLGRWEVELKLEPCSDRHHYMEIDYGVYNRAVVRVQPLVLTGEVPDGVIDIALTDVRIEQMVVHELLHPKLSGLKAYVTDDLDGQVHRDVLTVLGEGYQREEERVVDDLATILFNAYRGG